MKRIIYKKISAQGGTVAPITRRSGKSGLEPGTLVHIGEQRVNRGTISLITYDGTAFDEREDVSVEDLPAPDAWKGVLWVDVEGIHDVAVIEGVGKRFGLHGLLLEDVVNTHQRPKLEDYGTYLFMVLKSVGRRESFRSGVIEQISLILGPNFVISFREGDGALFQPIRERIRGQKSRLNPSGADFLAYSIIDVVVDGYFGVVEAVADSIEILEEKVVGGDTNNAPRAIHALKREMIAIRGVLWPTREMISNLDRAGGGPLIHTQTITYLRDVYDHVVQLMDTTEVLRDTLSGLLDIYLSSVSKKLNEIMKVLTIIATIFMPLTFIAGVYGMNFKHMPELAWPFGYPLVLLFMVTVASVMLLYFRKRKWI
jgi:magnesium transporter